MAAKRISPIVSGWILFSGIYMGMLVAPFIQENNLAAANESKLEILGLLANEIELIPGRGLHNLRLGEPMNQVQTRLGAPIRVEQTGVFNKKIELSYRTPGNNILTLIGDETLERIQLSGGAGSTGRTLEGARIGTSRQVVVQIYPAPSKSRKKRLEYRHRGVTFHFSGQQVVRIDVYPARS